MQLSIVLSKVTTGECGCAVAAGRAKIHLLVTKITTNILRQLLQYTYY